MGSDDENLPAPHDDDGDKGPLRRRGMLSVSRPCAGLLTTSRVFQ